MGASMSHIENEQEPCFKKSSRIKALHSMDEWKSHFNALKVSEKLVVIDFTAVWCGPCRSMEPVLSKFADKYTDVEFIEIDVDELQDVAAEFGVQAMPTYLLIKKGNKVDRVVGASTDELQTKIEKHRGQLIK